MTAEILLVRHARHDEVGRILSGRRPGLALSEAGRAEAERLARHLKGRGIVAIEASPQPRAQETAAIVARALRLPVRTAAALDEIEFGDWAGRSFAELEDDAGWRAWNTVRSRAAPPGGETMAAAAARAVVHVEALGRAGIGPVLCVSHADIIRAVVAHCLRLDPDQMLRFDIDPASVSAVVVGDWGARVTLLNAVAA